MEIAPQLHVFLYGLSQKISCISGRKHSGIFTKHSNFVNCVLVISLHSAQSHTSLRYHPLPNLSYLLTDQMTSVYLERGSAMESLIVRITLMSRRLAHP